MVVYSPDKKSFSHVKHAAVAITQSGDQLHIGLLYRSADDADVRLSHLITHRQFYDVMPPAKYCWANIPYKEEITLKQIAALCVLIAKNNIDSIPYGFRYNGQSFDKLSGAYISDTPGEGLTCATFVMAVFETLSLPLIIRSEWEFEIEDLAWQSHHAKLMAANLQLSPSSPQIKIWQEQFGSIRFKPEEVAAAATSSVKPLGRANAVKLAARIVKDVKKAAARPSSS